MNSDIANFLAACGTTGGALGKHTGNREQRAARILLGQRLRERRMQLKLSLADAMGLVSPHAKPATLRTIEAGFSVKGQLDVSRVALALGTTVEELLREGPAKEA